MCECVSLDDEREALIVLHARLKERLSPWAASASVLAQRSGGQTSTWNVVLRKRENLSLGTRFLLPVLLPLVSSFHTCRLQRRSSEAAAWTAALWKYRKTTELMNPGLSREAAVVFRGLKS